MYEVAISLSEVVGEMKRGLLPLKEQPLALARSSILVAAGFAFGVSLAQVIHQMG